MVKTMRERRRERKNEDEAPRGGPGQYVFSVFPAAPDRPEAWKRGRPALSRYPNRSRRW